MSLSPVMNVREVARYVKLSESTIRTLIRLGEIPYVKIRRRYIFHSEQIDRWLMANAVVPKPCGSDEDATAREVGRIVSDLSR